MLQHDVCAHCGTEFSKVKAWSRFCSKACQRAALAKQDKAARALLRAARQILAATDKEAA